MTVGDLIKNISELIAENDKHYRSVNAQLHDSRVVLKQMKEECKEKEEGRYECFELMKKLAAMPSEKMMEYFDSDNVAEIIRSLTYEYIERGINRYELEPKSKPEPKFKRGDIVDIIDRSNCSIVAEDAIYVDRGQNFWVVVLDGFIVTSKYDMDKYTLIGTEKVKESD